MNNTDYAAQQAARQFAADQLKQAFPHLVSTSTAHDGLVTAAKNIRIELARAFPGIKFSVKTSRFSGGDSIRINWTDGPTSSQVESIANQYEAGDFDGMTDSYNYRKDHAWTDAFGDAKYVSTSREYSPALVQLAIDFLWTKYRPQFPKISPDDYLNGFAWNVEVFKNGHPGDSNAQTLIHRFAHKYDCIANELAEDYRL